MSDIKFPTKRQFREYLEKHKPTAHVCKSGRCPLEQYFADTYSIGRVLISWNVWWPSVRDDRIDLPKWASKFVQRVDHLEKISKHRENTWGPLTAAEILACLPA